MKVGVDKIKTVMFPLPFIPSHQGRGYFWGIHFENVTRKFSDF